MRIQVTEAMFNALTASNLGYIMRQRGEVEVKVGRQHTCMIVKFRA